MGPRASGPRQYSDKVDLWSTGVVLYIMLVGSPPCAAFSRIQGLNSIRRDRAIFEKQLANAACAHIVFCFEMYEIQRKSCRFFMHEHPSSASSWSRLGVLKMPLKEYLELVEVDMCNF